jgi:hypothetical protein
MQKKPCVIKLNTNDERHFESSSPEDALKTALGMLNIKILTRRALKKARAVAIYFGETIIFPVPAVRTGKPHKDRYVNRARVRLARSRMHDAGRRRHSYRLMAA